MLIKGREVSEETASLALEEYFKNHPESYPFRAGDVIERHNRLELRLIVRSPQGILFAIDPDGDIRCEGQIKFGCNTYRKIGILREYLKKGN